MSADLPQSIREADDLPAPIEQTVQEIVDLVPEDKREQALTRIVKVVSTMEEFRGIMPHPQHAREYEEICPGAFDRMLSMREKELEYTIERDRTVTSNNIYWEKQDQHNADTHTKMGLYMGFALGVLLIFGAVVCAYLDQPWVGGALVAASAASMVSGFLNSRRDKGVRRDEPKQESVVENTPLRQNPRRRQIPNQAGHDAQGVRKGKPQRSK